MRQELEQHLEEKYPDLFKSRSWGPQQSLMCFGCDHGDGWFSIIDEMCQEIQSHIKEWPQEAKDRLHFDQIKEKFGTLRVYMSVYDKGIESILDKAAAKSAKTCETCGQPGERDRDHWYILTLCPGCKSKRDIRM